MKICKTCNKSFPATIEYFFAHNSTKDKLNPYCKDCHRARNRSNIQRTRLENPEYDKDYYEKNREKVLTRTRKYYKDNKELYSEWNKEWQSKNRQKVRDRHNEYYRKNSKERDRRKRNAKRRYANNPVVRINQRAYSRNYKARKKAAGYFSASDIANIYNEAKGLCAYCKNPVGTLYHIDHIIPLSRGGSNDPSNLCVACPKCNLSKGNKTPSEWVNRWYIA